MSSILTKHCLYLIQSIFLVAWLGNPLWATPSNQPDQHSKTILVFGDSLSAGYGLEKGQEWPALLQQRLSQQSLPYQIINHSITGETTAGGLYRLPQSLQASQPTILILALGANDGLRGLSLEKMQATLQQMINIAHRQNVQILLVGMHLPINYGQHYRQTFHQQFIDLAKKNNLAFLPFLLDGLETNIQMFLPDGLHPTAAAQPHIMNTVWPYLKPMLTIP